MAAETPGNPAKFPTEKIAQNVLRAQTPSWFVQVRHPKLQVLEVPQSWWVVFCYLVAKHDPARSNDYEFSRG